MLRTTITFCLLFSWTMIGHTAEQAEPTQETAIPRADEADASPEGWFHKVKPSVLKRAVKNRFATKSAEAAENLQRAADGTRIDPNLSPAVHVNSTGLENTYGSRKKSDAVERLRSVRDTPLMDLKTSQQRSSARKVQPRGAKATVRTSRRTLPAPPTQPATKPLDLTPLAETPPMTEAGKLPSVLTRRGLAEPTLALPTLAAPAKLPEPVFNAPQQPTASAPELQLNALNTSPQGPSLGSPSPVQVPTQQPQPLQVSPVFEIQPATPRVASLPEKPASSRKTQVMKDDSFTEITLSPVDTPAKPLKLGQEPVQTIRTQPITSQPIPSQPIATQPLPSRPVQTPAATATQPPTTAQPLQVRRTPERTVPPQQNAIRKTVKTKTPAKVKTKPAEDHNENELLSNRSPVLVVKTHGPTKIRVGRTATYYVTASNKGDLAAEDVSVDVNVPNWAELTRNQSTAGAVRVEPNLNGDNVLHWSIRDLKPGSNQRLRIDLIPRASRAIELGVTWNIKSVSAMAQIQVEEPKLQLSVVGPSDIRFGDTKLYSITVSNPGSGEAENVLLTLLPVNNNSGNAGERDLGNIKAGTQRTIEVELTARQAGDLAIRAQASADGGLRAEGQQPVRVRRPNLVVEAAGPKKRYAGTPARYTVKVTNNGDATARDIVATAGLPMGAKFVKSSKNGAFDKNRNMVQWSIGALRPGAYQIVEVTTILGGSGASRLDAKVAARPDQLTAAASAVTEVEALADLRLTVVDPVGPVPLETEVAYEIRIENRGTKAAKTINIVGYFSEGIEPVAIQGWQGDVQVGQVSLETIPQVSPGQRMVIKVMAQATRSGNHVFRAELDSNDPTTKTKLAVEEWTVFHQDGELLQATDDAPIQQAEKPAESDDLSLEEVLR